MSEKMNNENSDKVSQEHNRKVAILNHLKQRLRFYDENRRELLFVDMRCERTPDIEIDMTDPCVYFVYKDKRIASFTVANGISMMADGFTYRIDDMLALILKYTYRLDWDWVEGMTESPCCVGAASLELYHQIKGLQIQIDYLKSDVEALFSAMFNLTMDEDGTVIKFNNKKGEERK